MRTLILTTRNWMRKWEIDMRLGDTETGRWREGIVLIAIIGCCLIVSLSCGPNQKILNSAANSATPQDVSVNSPTSTTKADTLEQDIQAMKNADFNFIHVFRRKDGAVMDEDDKKFINAVTPAETNRRRLSDGGRAVIMGSNYRFAPETMKTLTDRFTMEDHSKPESEIQAANTNANSNN